VKSWPSLRVTTPRRVSLASSSSGRLTRYEAKPTDRKSRSSRPIGHLTTDAASSGGMMSTPRRHHTVTAGYIGRFARRGRVVVHRTNGSTLEIGPSAVGFQTDYWGSDAREVEQAFSMTESAALRILRRLDDRWPLSKEDRGVLAEFVAIHVIRTPAFGAFARFTSGQALDEAVREQAARHEVAEDELAAAAQAMRSQRFHVATLLGQVGRVGSAFGSMQWNLVRFDQNSLITSDQPVVALPQRGTFVSPASSVPASGLLNAMEVIFPLDPRQLLLMTWAEQPDAAQPLSGTYRQACSVNCAVRAQALTEWVSRPETTPPFLAPPILEPSVYAISTELLPGYSGKVAAGSKRRAAANQLAMRMIEENAPRDRMRWVTVAR
jgi:Protein of unknown function (DUF4238)